MAPRRRNEARSAPSRASSASSARPGGSGTWRKSGTTEAGPPERREDEGDPRGQRGLRRAEPSARREPERRRRQDDGQAGDEEQPAPEVAQGIAGGGHAVHLLRRGDVGQERIVEDETAVDADVGQDEQQGGKQPLPLPNEEHRRHGGGAEGRKAASSRFLAAEWSAIAPRIGERTAMIVRPSVVARLNREVASTAGSPFAATELKKVGKIAVTMTTYMAELAQS